MSTKARGGERYDKILCANCRSLQEFYVKTEREIRRVNGKDYEFNKRVAYCEKCGCEVMVPSMEDENEASFEYIFRKENDYIQIEEIKEIIDKYNIEKRPLSKLLGFGEHTIEKYLNGQLPNREYSDLLRKVNGDYRVMLYFYELNKDKLTAKGLEKIKEKLEYYKSINEYSSPIERYAVYILNSSYEITNLSLQKLLYYIEAFGQVILGEQLFNNRCEAWKLGPVYRDIYEKYKVFGSDQIVIDKSDTSDILDEKHRNLVDYVLKHFAIFNGYTLKELTHAETPWIEAHSGYALDERCEEQITHESIKDYFEKVNNKYKLNTDKGVKKYIGSLGVM